LTGRQRSVADNLISNPSFEVNTTGWTPGNATLTRTAGGLIGSFYGALAWNGTSNFYRINQLVSLSGSTAGRTFTLSYFVRGIGDTVGKNITLRLGEEGGSQATANYDSSGIALTADWQRVSLTATIAQDDRTGIRAYVGFRNSGSGVTTGDALDIDGIMLEESNHANPYTD